VILKWVRGLAEESMERFPEPVSEPRIRMLPVELRVNVTVPFETITPR